MYNVHRKGCLLATQWTWSHSLHSYIWCDVDDFHSPDKCKYICFVFLLKWSSDKVNSSMAGFFFISWKSIFELLNGNGHAKHNNADQIALINVEYTGKYLNLARWREICNVFDGILLWFYLLFTCTLDKFRWLLVGGQGGGRGAGGAE